MNLSKCRELFFRLKYPLLLFALGLLFLLMPGSRSSEKESGNEADILCYALEQAQGVGEAFVLLSDHGVVVVCRGADDAAVRLDIIRAIGSYTGYSSDKITILKMTGS